MMRYPLRSKRYRSASDMEVGNWCCWSFSGAAGAAAMVEKEDDNEEDEVV